MARASDSSALTAEATETYRRQVEQAASFVESEMGASPSVGLVKSAAAKSVGENLPTEAVCSVRDIPHFPSSSEDRGGHLRIGRAGETEFLFLDRMFPLYDGYTPRQSVFPVRMLAASGVDTLLFVTPVGSVHSEIEPSDLVLITDHINFQGVNPLVGPNVDDWGPRFPDMSEPYDPDLRRTAQRVALDEGVRLEKGILMATLGPNFGTSAEYGMVRSLGADVVGMSTVPEVIAARHMGVDVLTLAIVTDQCLPDALEPVSADDLSLALDAATPRAEALLDGILQRTDGSGA